MASYKFPALNSRSKSPKMAQLAQDFELKRKREPNIIKSNRDRL